MKERILVRSIVFFAMLTAISIVLRQVFAGLPNVQLMTAYLFVMVVFVGIWTSSLVMVLSLMMTGFFNGFGPWVGAQIVSYALLMLFWWMIQEKCKNIWLQAAITGGLSFVYGLLVGFLTAPFFGVTHFWTYYLQGVSFDFFHAVSTLLAYPILFIVFARVFSMKKRYDNADGN